jgi:hypothetical protein
VAFGGHGLGVVVQRGLAGGANPIGTRRQLP